MSKRLSNFIIFSLVCSVLYSLYTIYISYYYSFDSAISKSWKSFLLISVITILYIFFRRKIKGIELSVSVIFILKYFILAPKGFGFFESFYYDFIKLFEYGVNGYRILNIFMFFIWLSLMILPIIQFIYLKKNRIPPYNV